MLKETTTTEKIIFVEVINKDTFLNGLRELVKKTEDLFEEDFFLSREDGFPKKTGHNCVLAFKFLKIETENSGPTE